MPKYSLVIKARSKDEALDAAEDRGIDLDLVDKHPQHNEVIATCTVSSSIVLQRWLNEDLGKYPPYPLGALLQFKRVKRLASKWDRR